jgi:alpha/beta superfamily hydrolase
MAIMVEAITCMSGDLRLEAEVEIPDAPRAACVLCHPHPQHGGNMRSIVISALFGALPAAGVACLRFNYRGVDGSDGLYDGGVGERLDVVAAIDEMARRVDTDSLPLLLAGWSFGGDMALSTNDARIAGWFAVAPPLKMAAREQFDVVGGDPRPKRLALAQHDQFREPDAVKADTTSWKNTDITVIGGADHFFVGRTQRLVELATDFVAQLA